MRAMQRLLGGFLLILAILPAGCQSASPSMIGKWTCQTDLMGMDLAITAEYLADGTFKSVSQTQPGGNEPKLTATDTGTWKLDGDRLTVVLTDVDWKFSGANAEAIKRGEARFASSKATILQQANAQPTRVIRWSGSDEFSYSQEDKTYTYHRSR